ncbi:uncharacterized protein [Diadema antillarum]|uniref:uncharacterized protein n=1 Tax=Diadema antillarum TaxID=105358 RepID=UPI003A8B1690
MATLTLSSVLAPELNGAQKHANENGSDHDTVLSNLMEKLKMTSKQIKAWSHKSHKLRLAMSKYTEPDPVDPSRLQKCLDKLKMAIKVSSLPAMNERLDSIARQVGLKSTWSVEKTDVYLSSDCFYVEVILQPNGSVRDVMLALGHGMTGNNQSCPEMCEVLKKNDFKEFTEHLIGLCQMHQLGGDTKMKCTAFNCLVALETDLKTVFQARGNKKMPPPGTEISPLMHISKGPVGYLTPRVGGHPMRLTYFVSPYDLLDVEKKQTTELSNKEPLPKDLGLSVTVGIESGTQRKIQTAPTVMTMDNKITSILPLTNQNSIMIPATFVLKLSQPMPMSVVLIRQLQNIQGVSTQYADLSAATALNTLICRFTLDPVTLLQNQAKDGRHSRMNMFHVDLPDQKHSYIIDSLSPSDIREMPGALLSKINFTSPNNVTKIITTLRQQAVYNTLIASCVRSKDRAGGDSSKALLFEVAPCTHQKLTVTFEHPAKDGVAVVEFDLADHSSVKCKLHCPPNEEPFCSDEYATKVLQKCLSIPITMRAVMKKAEQWLETNQLTKPVSQSPAPSSGPSGGSVFDHVSSLHRHGGVGGGHGGSYFGSHRPHQSSSSHQLHSHSILSDLTTTLSAILPHGEAFEFLGDKPTKVAQNPMLASLLQHAAGVANSTAPVAIPPPSPSPISSPPLPSGPRPHKNPMLMNLLQEHNTLTPVAAIAQPLGQSGRGPKKMKRVRSVSVDKSPKRQASEDDHDDDMAHRMQIQHRLSEMQKLTQVMDPPRSVPQTGELSALLSEIDHPIQPAAKPKRGRPPRLDSTSSQSSVGARQSPKTPSIPSVPTTPTFAPPKAMSHSTLSTPEHSSVEDIPAVIKAEPLHRSVDSDIFSHQSKNLFAEDLLPDPPRSSISPETGRRASCRSQYSLDSIDINEDLLKNTEVFDNDDEFGSLPSVHTAIHRMGIPTGNEFDEQHRTTTDLPPPVSLSALTSGPLSTAIQAGLETRTDMAKMTGGALDLSVSNLTKSLSLDMATGSSSLGGKPAPLSRMQGVTNLSQSLPAARPRVPVSKGKPKNFTKSFTESGPSLQSEGVRRGSKKRSRRGARDGSGFSDSDAPKPKKRGRQKKKLPETYSSESSPEPCQDHGNYSSVTMAVNIEQPLKMTFKTIRHKPEKEQKSKAKDSGPAPPKIKIRPVTSGDSATPSPTPGLREVKEEKPDSKAEVKSEVKVEQPERAEPVMKSIKPDPSALKTEIEREAKPIKEEGPRVLKDVSKVQVVDDQTTKGLSQDVQSKGTHDVAATKSEPPSVKPYSMGKSSPMPNVTKAKVELVKKARSLDSQQRASSVPRSPIAGFFPKTNISSLPRIPKLSKQASESKQQPGSKMPSAPKPASSPSPNAKSPLLSSPKRPVWGKGDSPKLVSPKKILQSGQRITTVSPTGRKPDGAKPPFGKSLSTVSKSPLAVGQGVRRQGPNILSKSMSTSTYGSKASAAAAQVSNRGLLPSSLGSAKSGQSQVKLDRSPSPVPKTSTSSTPKPQPSVVNVKPPAAPTSSSASKVSSSQGTASVSSASNSTPSIASSTSSYSSTTITTAVNTTSTTSTTSSTSAASVIPNTSSYSSTPVPTTSDTTPLTVTPSAAQTVPTASPISTAQTTSPNTTTTTACKPVTVVSVSTTSSSTLATTSIPPTSSAAALSQSTPQTPTKTTVPVSKSSTTTSNKPPPLEIPASIKTATPSLTSPTTPLSASTPTSAGPSSGKVTTPKPRMRVGRKESLMGIINKIKENAEKESVEKVDKVEKSEKAERVERVGLFSALGSAPSGLGEGAGGEEKEKPDSGKDTKTSTPEISGNEKMESAKPSKSGGNGKMDMDTPTKEKKLTDMTFSVAKSESAKPQVSKGPVVSGPPLPTRQPSPSPLSRPSGLISSPSAQTPGVVKSKSSPKHPSQSRPPKVSTPPLGGQKRASSPTGKSISVKQSKPSPLSTSSIPTSSATTSPVKSAARPGTSPISRNKPIILSHVQSTYQSAERGQQKVTKVQLAVTPEMMQTSVLTVGQTPPSTTGVKLQTSSSQPRMQSPSVKSQTPSTSKPSELARKTSLVLQKSSPDMSKTESKPLTVTKLVKQDQGPLQKPKPTMAKEPGPQSQQSSIQGDGKGSSEAQKNKTQTLSVKKQESKPVDPRMKREVAGVSKEKEGDPVKTSKPGVMRSVSKDAKDVSENSGREGKQTAEVNRKTFTTQPQQNKNISQETKSTDKDKLKTDDIRKVDPRTSSASSESKLPEKDTTEEMSKSSTVSKQPGIDFKVPSPAMVPSPRNPTVMSVPSPKPAIKSAPSPKPLGPISPKAPSPQQISTGGVTSPSSAPSPKATKRSSTPINLQQPVTKKARQVASPYSPVDSEEEFGMVIDMPQSPRTHHQKAQRSPRPESRNSNTQTEAGSTSPRSAVAHSPLGQIAQSPLGIGKSPASVKSLGSDSVSRSPCRIDDELMDEALITSIHPEDQ